MAIVKHIGRQGDRKVVVLFRTVPDEDHMCLLIYPETLPRAFHDSIMQVVESPAGQDADNIAEVLARNLLPDGRPILGTLHVEKMIKKVPTSQIIMTPNAKSHVRLDELNTILKGMEQGSEAAKKMEELDVNAGLVDPVERKRQAALAAEAGETVLGNDALAQERMAQSEKMAAEAEQLLVESKRLKLEAYDLNPALKPRRGRKPGSKTKTA